MKYTCSAIILAGGNSRRMGVNKLLLPWGSGTLLSNVINLIQSSFSDIVIVGDKAVCHSIPADHKTRFITDEIRSGPLYGILIGLQAIEHDRALVVAADLPLITYDAINYLVQDQSDADVTVMRTDNGDHPLFGIYHKNCISAISSCLDAGFRKVTHFWEDVNMRIIDVGSAPEWKRCLLNINSPEDYRKAQELNQNENMVNGKPITSAKY